ERSAGVVSRAPPESAHCSRDGGPQLVHHALRSRGRIDLTEHERLPDARQQRLEDGAGASQHRPRPARPDADGTLDTRGARAGCGTVRPGTGGGGVSAERRRGSAAGPGCEAPSPGRRDWATVRARLLSQGVKEGWRPAARRRPRTSAGEPTTRRGVPMPAPLPRRRTVLAAALAGPPLAALTAAAAHADDPEPEPAFTPGEPWRDTSGEVIQSHGGQVLVGEDADGPLYHWHGGDRTNGYGSSPGVHVYSSRDLYSWTDEGLALRALATAEELETDPYFTALYGECTEEQKAAVVRDLLTTAPPGSSAPAAILERPKVLHNAAKGTWVMWVHADGPSETSDAQYAKARAGVAVSDSPTGPFRWIDSYRLHHAPEGEPNWQPDN